MRRLLAEQVLHDFGGEAKSGGGGNERNAAGGVPAMLGRERCLDGLLCRPDDLDFFDTLLAAKTADGSRQRADGGLFNVADTEAHRI